MWPYPVIMLENNNRGLEDQVNILYVKAFLVDKIGGPPIIIDDG
jgi:hypothetical protein